MAHELDMTNGRANIAYLESGGTPWHRMGQAKKEGQSKESWIADAGIGWRAIMLPAFRQLPSGEMIEVPGYKHICRSDNFEPLGYATDGYKPVQPIESVDWLDDFIRNDPRFALDVVGSLRGGRTIWATAIFRDPIKVAGDAHRPRLLMSTSYDSTQATINRANMERVVCANTLATALGENKAHIKTRHNTRFDAQRVASRLADIVKSYDQFKVMGDAMAQVHMSESDIVAFFKSTLDIPHDAKKEEVSTRKFNQFADVFRCYQQTTRETEAGTAWAALNAVTRYADHNRGTRNAADNGGEEAARFFSANFGGSGEALKQAAINLLTKSYANNGDWSSVRNTASVPVPAGMAAAAFGTSN